MATPFLKTGFPEIILNGEPVIDNYLPAFSPDRAHHTDDILSACANDFRDLQLGTVYGFDVDLCGD